MEVKESPVSSRQLVKYLFEHPRELDRVYDSLELMFDTQGLIGGPKALGHRNFKDGEVRRKTIGVLNIHYCHIVTKLDEGTGEVVHDNLSRSPLICGNRRIARSYFEYPHLENSSDYFFMAPA